MVVEVVPVEAVLDVRENDLVGFCLLFGDDRVEDDEPRELDHGGDEVFGGHADVDQ